MAIIANVKAINCKTMKLYRKIETM